MSNSKKRKRKPQITIQLTDEKGDRAYVAADMGFGDPYWAGIKSRAIIDSASHIEPPLWIMLVVRYDKEIAFTKFIERIFKRRKSHSEYLIIRAKSPNQNDIDSWFFIHNMELDAIANKSKRYSDTEPALIDSDKLKLILECLFDVNNHPDKPRLRRWDASRTTRQMLRLIRLKHLIQDAREYKEHELAERVPAMANFERRLARFIKRDMPLIYKMKPKDVFVSLAKLEKTGIITRDETVKVILNILERRKWKRAGKYKGLPKVGAKRDRENGRFFVWEGRLYAYSELISELTAWEVEEHLEGEPGEEYLE